MSNKKSERYKLAVTPDEALKTLLKIKPKPRKEKEKKPSK